MSTHWRFVGPAVVAATHGPLARVPLQSKLLAALRASYRIVTVDLPRSDRAMNGTNYLGQWDRGIKALELEGAALITFGAFDTKVIPTCAKVKFWFVNHAVGHSVNSLPL